jgi:protein SCO1/2
LCFAISKLAIIAQLAILGGCAKHYHADGMLLRADAVKQTVFISHRDIGGYMPAMAMEFHAKHVPDLAPGARITFELAVKQGNAVVTHIASRGGVAEFTTPTSLAVGSPVPDFTLIDPREKLLSLSSLRGEVVALNFIYTRCPQPDVCPRLSADFARLQRRFGRSLKLLSITIDPRYDNPSVLDGYAKLWNADQESWHFLTGSESEIRAVASTFGLVYFAEDGSMTHSSRTAVIGRDGRLAGMVEGSAFAVSQLGDLISLAMEAR